MLGSLAGGTGVSPVRNALIKSNLTQYSFSYNHRVNANLPIWVTVAILVGGTLGAIIVIWQEQLLLIALPVLFVHLILVNALGMNVALKIERRQVLFFFLAAQFVILICGDWVRSPYEFKYVPRVAFVWGTGMTALYVFDSLIMASAATIRWKQWQRDLEHDDPYCLYCDYNLTGINSNRCPECGEEITR